MCRLFSSFAIKDQVSDEYVTTGLIIGFLWRLTLWQIVTKVSQGTVLPSSGYESFNPLMKQCFLPQHLNLPIHIKSKIYDGVLPSQCSLNVKKNMKFSWWNPWSLSSSEAAQLPKRFSIFNHLTPNVHYMGRTAQLTSRCCILYIYSTNIRTEYFKHVA